MNFIKNFQLRAWVAAIRIHTLPAIVAPVIVGTCIAINDGVYNPFIVSIVLLCALLIQIGTNISNDYFDALNSVDAPGREGFVRVTSAGLISEKDVKKAWIFTFFLAIIFGSYLLYIGGIPILLIGLFSIAAGILYTGGPYPFGYHGLGDLFVFIFFGIVAVTGTYYVQSVSTLSYFPLWFPPGTISQIALISSLSMATLTTAIIVVNNTRDIDTDSAAGKFTLSVFLGKFWSKVEYSLLILLSYCIPIFLYLYFSFSNIILLPLITLPYGLFLIRSISYSASIDSFNRILKNTTLLTLIFSILFGIGLSGLIQF